MFLELFKLFQQYKKKYDCLNELTLFFSHSRHLDYGYYDHYTPQIILYYKTLSHPYLWSLILLHEIRHALQDAYGIIPRELLEVAHSLSEEEYIVKMHSYEIDADTWALTQFFNIYEHRLSPRQCEATIQHFFDLHSDYYLKG